MQKVTEDTAAVEKLENGGEIRRLVFAGAVVPDHWELESGGEKAEEDEVQTVPSSGDEAAEPGPVDSTSTTPKRSTSKK